MLSVSHQGVAPLQPAPLSPQEQSLHPGGRAVLEQTAGDGPEVTQLPCPLLQSCCTVQVWPFAVMSESWPLQMSPISPQLLSYQPRGGPGLTASPTSVSVTASTSSCECTAVAVFSAPLMPQALQGPVKKSGCTP
jgi:hypothetical protein